MPAQTPVYKFSRRWRTSTPKWKGRPHEIFVPMEVAQRIMGWRVDNSSKQGLKRCFAQKIRGIKGIIIKWRGLPSEHKKTLRHLLRPLPGRHDAFSTSSESESQESAGWASDPEVEP